MARRVIPRSCECATISSRMSGSGVDVRAPFARPAQLPFFGDDPFGESDRADPQIPLDDCVDRAQRLRLPSRHRIAVNDDLQRRCDADEARQALRTPGPRDKAEFHFRQTNLGARHSHAEMARQRDFETTPQRRAVDRGKHRLLRVFDPLRNLRQPGLDKWFAEFAYVRAGKKRTARAQKHNGGDVSIGNGRGQRFLELPAHDLR